MAVFTISYLAFAGYQAVTSLVGAVSLSMYCHLARLDF